MDALKIFSNPKFGQVRIVADDASNELLFCANDITDALGYTNGRDAVARHVEKDDVVKHDMGGSQNATPLCSKMRHSSNKYRLIN